MEKNTFFKFKMDTDEVLDLTLNFYRLYKLKAKNEKVYKEYFRILSKGPADEFDMLMIVYTGYLCAHVDDEELEYPDFESFLMDVPEERDYLWNAYTSLMGIKKKQVPRRLPDAEESGRDKASKKDT